MKPACKVSLRRGRSWNFGRC